MGGPGSRKRQTSQEILRGVLELCADCDTCRTLMDVDCAFFPELYRLWDQEQAGGAITAAQLRRLAELCTLCGLCPCPKIPVQVMEAKNLSVDREGLSLSTRLLTDVPRLARWCGTFPRLANALQGSRAIGPLLRKALRIHPERQLPAFPEENFFQWAARNGKTGRREGNRSVAYFAGCTAGYLFPRIGRSVVEVLERNGLTVYLPPQECCGMPFLLEGERQATMQRARSNMDHLLASVQAGDDVVCSCPTCGLFMRSLLLERAYYSDAYQQSVNAGPDELKVPDLGQGHGEHRVLKKSIYKDILKDDGYFSSLDPLARIRLAGNLFDVGEYLGRLHAGGKLDTGFNAIPGRMVYFAPCHQREQKIGRPYLDLLALIPGLTVEQVGEMECCGMGGNFGFKAEFHEQSLAIGRPLMEKIRRRKPQGIITDCMSCRLQFSHALPYPVFHPLEILAGAYARGESC